MAEKKPTTTKKPVAPAKKAAPVTKKASAVKKPVAATKTAEKPEVKTDVKKSTVKKTPVEATVATRPARKAGDLKIDVFDLKGTVTETIELPKEVFGAKVNKMLIAQAVRVYLANQREGAASTKSRGEVQGSSRKIYRQKGTGRARHGGVRAPIFVHGGVAHGPKPRDYSLDLPQKMRRAALFSALTAKLQSNEITIVGGLEKMEAKTKKMAQILEKLSLSDKKRKVLLVTPDTSTNVRLAARNLEGVTYTAAKRLNTYEVLNSKMLVFMKDSLTELENTFLKKEQH